MKKKWYQKKTKLGFTLIELLAVIIIIAIIALIIVPMATNYMESSRRKGFTTSVYHAMDSIKEDLASNDFEKFPEGGFAASTELEGLERNPFIGGTFVEKDGELYADRVTDGRYCAIGTLEDLEVVLGGCYLLDKTAPVINSVAAGITTSNSIQVVVDAYDDESDIVSYEYSKDNGDTFSEKQKENTYTFTDLKHDTPFSIVVRVTNENQLSTKADATLRTIKINMPTFTSDPAFDKWSKSKVITIHYQDPKESNFIYEYRKDNGEWMSVASGVTQDVTFDANGSLEARVRDGYNTVSATTLTLTTIDTVAPTCDTVTTKTGWTNQTVTITGICTDTGGSGCDVNPTQSFSTNTNAQKSPGTVSDKAGNTATCDSVLVQVDKTKPTCSTTTSHSGWTNQTVTLTGTCNDTGGSGCAGTAAKQDFTTNTNGNYSPGTVKDAAGNVSDACPTKLVQVDKTKPTCETTTNHSGWTNQAVTITGTCTDTGGSGCVANVTKSYPKTNTNKTESPGTVKDNAGNVSDACPTIAIKIDITPPAVPTIGCVVSTTGSYTTDLSTAYSNKKIFCSSSKRKAFLMFKYTSSDSGGSGLANVYAGYWYDSSASAGCGGRTETDDIYRKKTSGFIADLVCNSGGKAHARSYACDKAGNCSAKSSIKTCSWNVDTIKGYISTATNAGCK